MIYRMKSEISIRYDAVRDYAEQGEYCVEFGVGLKLGFGVNWTQLAGSFKHF